MEMGDVEKKQSFLAGFHENLKDIAEGKNPVFQIIWNLLRFFSVFILRNEDIQICDWSHVTSNHCFEKLMFWLVLSSLAVPIKSKKNK